MTDSAAPRPQIRAPRSYALGEDFALWLRRYEAYVKAVEMPEDKHCAALLSMLDDAAFRAYDLLGLSATDAADYKKLVEELRTRFSSTAGQQELRWQLNHRTQEPEETLDTFADALLFLANGAYPLQDRALRMELVRDRFVAGLRDDKLQEAVMQSPVEALATLDKTRETAKRIEAAQTARRKMNQTRKAMSLALDDSNTTPTAPAPSRVANVGHQPAREDGLAAALDRNTQVLQQLLLRITSGDTPANPPRQQRRRRPPGPCWKCGQQGHLQRNCPEEAAGNDQRPTPRVNRRPQNQ